MLTYNKLVETRIDLTRMECKDQKPLQIRQENYCIDLTRMECKGIFARC